jgi:hypothetical protein
LYVSIKSVPETASTECNVSCPVFTPPNTSPAAS